MKLDTRDKLDLLEKIIAGYERAVAAFSGGVDSAFLLSVARDVLNEKLLAVTISSPVVPPREVEEAEGIARTLGVAHMVITSNEMEIEEFRSNQPDRCYHCKMSLFSRMIEVAKERGYRCVMEASNQDDMNDYRPGFRAIQKLGVKSPLVEAGFTKDEIRALSKERGLSTWDKPAMACLASRIPYYEPITLKKLEQIRKGEEFLVSEGFRLCRLRHHGQLARIEVHPSEVNRLFNEPLREKVAEYLKSLGFQYVTVDLQGYRSGSLNEALDELEGQGRKNRA
jgi:uncharacterized protein